MWEQELGWRSLPMSTHLLHPHLQHVTQEEVKQENCIKLGKDLNQQLPQHRKNVLVALLLHHGYVSTSKEGLQVLC